MYWGQKGEAAGLDLGMEAHSPWPGALGSVRAEAEGRERRSGKAVRRLSARALDLGRLSSNPDPVAPLCVTLGKSLRFSEFQYPHL